MYCGLRDSTIKRGGFSRSWLVPGLKEIESDPNDTLLMDNKKKIEAENVLDELLSSSLFTTELKPKSKVESQGHIEDQSHLESNGRTRDKKSGLTSQLGEQNIIDNIVDKANVPLLLSLPSSTESGSNTSLLLSQNSPSTSTVSSTVTRNTELLLSSRSRPLLYFISIILQRGKL